MDHESNSTAPHSADPVPLTGAIPVAAAKYGCANPPPGGYRRLQTAIADGRLPVVRQGRSVYVQRQHLGKVAEIAGLLPAVTAA